MKIPQGAGLLEKEEKKAQFVYNKYRGQAFLTREEAIEQIHWLSSVLLADINCKEFNGKKNAGNKKL